MDCHIVFDLTTNENQETLSHVVGVYADLEDAKRYAHYYACMMIVQDYVDADWHLDVDQSEANYDSVSWLWRSIDGHRIQILQASMDYKPWEVSTLKTMPYEDYLNTPHWHEVREAALERAGHRCQVCNHYGKNLQAHHRTYENRGNESPQDIIILCGDCHALFHENGKVQR